MKRAIWIACLGLLAALILWAFVDLEVNEFVRCWRLRSSLLLALDNASSVKVVEHSCREDNPSSENDSHFKETIYATKTLTSAEITALRKAIPESRDISGTTFLSCIFEEHHRIEIVEKNGDRFVLRLCFGCGELEVNDGGQRIMPVGWSASLGSFMSSLGLHPKGPWR